MNNQVFRQKATKPLDFLTHHRMLGLGQSRITVRTHKVGRDPRQTNPWLGLDLPNQLFEFRQGRPTATQSCVHLKMQRDWRHIRGQHAANAMPMVKAMNGEMNPPLVAISPQI